MKKTIIKPACGGVISSISSKSMAHRMMIAKALSFSDKEIICNQKSKDIEATEECLSEIKSYFSENSKEKTLKLYCKESGSTLRFLLPIVAALGIKAEFYMEGRLSQRPLSPLYEEMVKHGCTLSKQGISPIILEGKLSGGDYYIAGNISSQYITGLLFALPLCEENSRIIINGELESKPYIEMTLDVLKKCGIIIKEDEKGFIIKGQQKYEFKKNHIVEGDWSNAAFWLCLGAISENPVTVKNLNINSKQGDKRVIEILREFGAEVMIEENIEENFQKVKVSKKEIKNIIIDAKDIPDLIPILTVVACAAENGITRIINAGRLRLKESDRILAIKTTLSKMGANISETEDGLIIEGKGRLKGGEINSFNDHRIAMMAAIAATICSENIIIDEAEAVEKSYPDFFRDYLKLGGEVV